MLQFLRHRPHHALHSFPTRRSSDLIRQHTRVPMNSHGTAEEGLAAVTSAIDELLKLAPDKNAARRPIGICAPGPQMPIRSEEHTSELQSRRDLVCRLLLEKKKRTNN